MPIAWKGKVAQYAGRLHRLLDNKKDVVIYDYADIHVPVLERMYHKRVKSYAEIGYKILGCEGVENNPNIIYNTENYSKAFYEDIRKANCEIVVFASSLKKDRITNIAKEFAIAMLNGTVVTIITTQTESFKPEMKDAVSRNIEHLQNFGIKVIQKEKVHQNFAVIDCKITWYGNINFMGFATDEEITIRIDDVDIASEFIKMV
ncbi:MAG: phospholipase D-like domain-containing protein [Bacillota bacterium]